MSFTVLALLVYAAVTFLAVAATVHLRQIGRDVGDADAALFTTPTVALLAVLWPVTIPAVVAVTARNRRTARAARAAADRPRHRA